MDNTNQVVDGRSHGLTLPLQKGPFQNNGASPWYAIVGVGTPNQALKFSFDTGSNFNWVTSTLCGPETCHHFGGSEFNYKASRSFEWVSRTPMTVDFGPWGEMKVSSGEDILALSTHDNITLKSDLYLSSEYEGSQFDELNWDGGIGLPSYSHIPLKTDTPKSALRGHHQCHSEASFHFMESLLAQNVICADAPYVGFSTDPDSKQGEVTFGALNPDYADSREYLFLPWDRYAANTAVESLYYIWTTPMSSMKMGDDVLCEANDNAKQWFCLDTGSSQFKGDPDTMFSAYQQAGLYGKPLSINFPGNACSLAGEIEIPKDLYDVKIEHGELEGKIVPQFQPMQGLDALTLVGSVLMDSLYTVYQYRVNEARELEPVGMWLFNKPDGPNIIKTRQTKPPAIYLKDFSSDFKLTGRWENSYGSQMDLLTQASGEVWGSYSSTTGASGCYYVYGWSAAQNPTQTEGQAVALAITWRAHDVGAEPNDSWRWMSTYCGQMVDDTQLSVINSLVATNHYGGAQVGDFLDKLAFKKCSSVEKQQDDELLSRLFNKSGSVSSPFNGDWWDEQNESVLRCSVVDEQQGLINIQFEQHGKTTTLKGFADTLAPLSGVDIKRRSLSVAGKGLDEWPISISGYLDLEVDALIVNLWTAHGTSVEDSYMQANAQQLFFTRTYSSKG
ncbi:pepsin-like aspartic protease [Vibrio tapetis subsp. quintayensis]|uniref:pepsin-like aspartic protease n=1 Tax=Vibrio tapetis TaxID=52443 RepID=UPI0025B2BEFF|nr:pepsin-like aspartic protease [Vibrio tapetis]MDN3680469.1 pepsin-like aspartic protease [Vibrio tapetis subsp. quintayensis]